jgi:hypothetical protein
MPPLTLQGLRTRGLVDELANVFDNPPEAAALLDSVGFPRSRQPQFQAVGTARGFWLEACRAVANGLTPGGLEALLAAAAELYPHNPALLAWRSGTTGPGGRTPAALSPPAAQRPVQDRLKVFLCHAAVDKPQVLQYYHRLTALDVEAWLDKESLNAGEEWEPAIRRAIRRSHAVVVFLSRAFVVGAGVRNKEIKLALDVYDEQPEGTIFLIPAGLEPCETPVRLQDFHRVDLFDGDGFDKVVRALRARAAGLGLSMS